jgi:hypothetical protein
MFHTEYTWARDWTNRNKKKKKKKHWEPTTGLKQAKGLIPGPSARRRKDLLKLNKDQLRCVVGLFTGHCHLNRQLFELGLTDEPLANGASKKMNQPHTSYVTVRLRPI